MKRIITGLLIILTASVFNQSHAEVAGDLKNIALELTQTNDPYEASITVMGASTGMTGAYLAQKGLRKMFVRNAKSWMQVFKNTTSGTALMGLGTALALNGFITAKYANNLKKLVG